ncbi:MAG TPA: cyclase family protein [Candidatus Nitrosocosmicus sp.]|nr:cyclase family protein [Candidatus Nitrosocosmicus sp.]
MSNIIDISIEISEQLPVWPGEQQVAIRQTRSMDDGDSCNVAFFTMGMHAGTHVDVPLHFVRDGKDTASIELDRFAGRAKVFEFDSQIEVDVAALEGLDITKDDIVLLKALRNEKLLLDNVFHKDYIYLSTEAASFLVKKGIKAVGINYFSIEKFNLPGNATHKMLLENGVIIIEGLKLDGVLPGEYQGVFLPLKFEGGNGSPTRAILIRNKEYFR